MSVPRHHSRRPSLPLPLRPDAVTVPLRPCCRECYPITEECLKEGVAWEEKFTRGARRRRNSSADTHAHQHFQRHRRVCDEVPGFGTIVSVDEVEKRRSSLVDEHALSDGEEPTEADAGLLPSFSRRLNLVDDGNAPTSKARPIAEEPEDEDLFPLPSHHASSSRPLPSPPQDPAWSLTTDHQDEPSRSSVYYTPDTSPAIPIWEPSSSTSSPFASDSPVTPPQPFARSVPIPSGSNYQAPAFGDFSLSSFEVIQTPSSPLISVSSHPTSASPSHHELPTSPSGRRKQLLHMPSLPSAGSFFRAGADIFKGVTAMGTGGPMPLSV